MRNSVLFCMMVAASFCCACTPEVEICKWRDGADAAVSLTFDDGIIDHYTLVAPCLDGLGLKGTFWVNPAFIGHEDDYAPRMTWDNCRYMASDGHEISSHGWSHKNLCNMQHGVPCFFAKLIPCFILWWDSSSVVLF